MLIGSQVHTNATSWEQALKIAQQMDAGPWASVFVPDHFVPPLAFLDEGGDCFEGWSMLTAFAAATKKLKLGALVTGYPGVRSARSCWRWGPIPTADGRLAAHTGLAPKQISASILAIGGIRALLGLFY